MKTLILVLSVLFTQQALAAEYKIGTLQHVASLRQMEEIMNPAAYYASQLRDKLDAAGTLSRGQGQIFLSNICREHAQLVTRINMVEIDRIPRLQAAKAALEGMKCEHFERLEFTSLRELRELDRKFQVAYSAIREHNWKVFNGESPVSARGQVREEYEAPSSSSAR